MNSVRTVWTCLLLPLALAAASMCAVANQPATETSGGGCPGVDSSPLIGPDFEQALASGSARPVFVYVPAEGFAYRKDGRLTGVTVELLRDFADYLTRTHGLTIEPCWLEQTDWRRFYNQVRDAQGGVFGIGNVTITQARRSELAFSPPYLRNIAVLVSHQDVPELQRMDEVPQRFAGLTALEFTGTLHADRTQALASTWLPDLERQGVSSNDELVRRIAEGAGAFGYMDAYNYWRAVEAGLPLRQHAIADDGDEAFGVILPLSGWQSAIDAFFAEAGGYAGSERYRRHLREHLGETLAALLTAEPPPDISK